MQTFLEKLSQYHLENHLTEINDFCFVFPSRRAGLFFSKELSSRIEKPTWSPEIMTINEFFGTLNPTPVSDTITLLFKLHIVYQEVMRSNITIDEFLPMGEMFLNDFNDIDNYLADADQVFSNLAATKAMEDDFSHLSKDQVDAIRTFWSSFDPERISEQQESFLSVWDKLAELYKTFKSQLSSEGLAYQGMISRSVAEKVRNERAMIVPYKKVIFAGFNALNNCEKKVFNQLYIQNKATLFWDYPQWIVPEKTPSFIGIKNEHEAYRFLHYNLNQFPSPKDWEDPFNKEFPKITIASASNELVQTTIAHQFLNKIELGNSKDEKTGLILADEKQLLPVLHSIPEKFKSINITLGYPLKNTPAFALVDSLLAMQKSTRRTKEGKTWFYHREVMALLRHQYMNVVLGDTGAQLIQRLIKTKQIFILKEEFKEDALLSTIFTKVDTTSELAEYLNKILILVYDRLSTDGSTKVEQEFIYFLFTAIKRLSDILAELTQVPSPETWQSLFRKLAMQQSVPFKGEPLSGLQIMGILETRSIDFENLVIVGLTEGTFPKTSPPVSFIPYNLRKGFDLPTIDNQDSIFAYYFYRLIHRAKNVRLIYTTNQALTEESEMSRFLQQLYYEYPGEVVMETIAQKVNVPRIPKLKATKNEEVMKVLDQWITPDGRNLSPSALSIYLTCPLKFYYQYVLGIKEPDEIIEDLDPRTFGNLFHKIVEFLYNPFIGKEVSKSDISALLAKKEEIKIAMQKIFNETLLSDSSARSAFNDLQGKNSLVFEVIFNYIIQFLKQEEKRAPFKLLALEEKVAGNFHLKNGKTVNLGGTIDRTEKKEGSLRIIDYKTGSTERKFSETEQLFSQKDHDGKKAIFQTLLYALIKSETTECSTILPEVISVRELHSKNYSTEIYWNKDLLTLNSIVESFKESLENTLTDLFNPEIPFTQTENKKSCEYCNFKKHCLIN